MELKDIFRVVQKFRTMINVAKISKLDYRQICKGVRVNRKKVKDKDRREKNKKKEKEGEKESRTRRKRKRVERRAEEKENNTHLQ